MDEDLDRFALDTENVDVNEENDGGGPLATKDVGGGTLATEDVDGMMFMSEGSAESNGPEASVTPKDSGGPVKLKRASGSPPSPSGAEAMKIHSGISCYTFGTFTGSLVPEHIAKPGLMRFSGSSSF